MTIIRRYTARGEVSPGATRTPLQAGAPTHRPALRRLAAAVCLALAATFTGFLGLIPAQAEPMPHQPVAAPEFGFDPGNIISDAVFYDTAAMTEDQVREFISGKGAGCTGPMCLPNVHLTTPDLPADRYCAAYPGGVQEDAAAILSKVSTACGISPQVMLVTLQKESGLLTRTDVTETSYDAAFGWHCPDTGPAGTANCDPAHAGLFNQSYGMAKQWARYRLDPDRYNYRAGQTANIMWNVQESGCGSAPVTIANTATAALYNYTPYQPNAAALSSYPGPGDACSAYGNRNFSHLFQEFFGSTHRDGASITPAAAFVANPATVPGDPIDVTIPEGPNVPADLAGQSITAPNPAVAAGLRAGLQALDLPYVWGGGGSGAGPNNGCGRGGGDFNSCGTTIGFDCSGLTAYVLGQAGYRIPGNSGTQRSAGVRIGWDQALPGDVVGFPGHVAVYLGSFAGRPHILEASWVGTPIHIVPLTRADADPQLYRYWTGPAQVPPTAVDFTTIVRGGYAAGSTGAPPSTSGTSEPTGRQSWRSPTGRTQPGPSTGPQTQPAPAPVDQPPAAPTHTPSPAAPAAAPPPAATSSDAPAVPAPPTTSEPPAPPTTAPPTTAPPTTAPPNPPAETPTETEPGTDESGGPESGGPESGGAESTPPPPEPAEAPPTTPEQPTDAAPEPEETPAEPAAEPDTEPAPPITESPEPRTDPAPAAPTESRPVIEAAPPTSDTGDDAGDPADTATAVDDPPPGDEDQQPAADTAGSQQ